MLSIILLGLLCIIWYSSIKRIEKIEDNLRVIERKVSPNDKILR